MDAVKACCQMLGDTIGSSSPFDRVIALSYNDGPTEGFLGCHGCGAEYLFRMLDDQADSADESDRRIFGLSRLPEGTIEQFSEAMAPYQRPPVGPLWAPLWSFPSESVRDQMSSTVDHLESAAGPVELIIASTSWLDGEIIASRSVSPADSLEPRDWFEFLGLARLPVEG